MLTASGIEWVTIITVARRVSPLPTNAQQLLVENVAGELIERAERLVEQQKIGVAHQGPGQRRPLLHAA